MDKKYDWLGLCLEMMIEYYPIEVRSKNDAEKYWGISEHLLRAIEHIDLKYRKSGDSKSDKRSELVRDMVRLFSQSNIDSLAAGGETGANKIIDNVALNNLLLLSILG